MPATELNLLMRQLRRAVAPAAPDPDAELLERFSRDRDEAAFAALVERHGPMGWRVCRRVLGTVRLWDVQTGKSTAVFRGSGGDVNGVAFSPTARPSPRRTSGTWGCGT